MKKHNCPACGEEMKLLQDLIDRRNYKPVNDIFWCSFCGVLQDINAIDTHVNKPTLHDIRKVRERRN
jgi:uncharacterized Zn finger protein